MSSTKKTMFGWAAVRAKVLKVVRRAKRGGLRWGNKIVKESFLIFGERGCFCLAEDFTLSCLGFAFLFDLGTGIPLRSR
ncbi:MAG: hypothetical protein ACJAQT_002485 [Akkermansiaceae bacterium]|jgi:hypothetical protein